MGIVCSQCGADNLDAASFCAQCHAPLPARGRAISRDPFTPVFVGRQAELAEMRQCLDTALAGQGHLLMLAGEAGVGKTALAQRFAHEARQRGVAVLWGASYEGDWQPPYGAWDEALSALLDTQGAQSAAETLGDDAGTLAGLGVRVQTALPAAHAPAELGLVEARRRLYDAVTRLLLARASQQALLLVLEDLHWADTDSLQLLQYLGRFLSRSHILVLGLYRDPELGLNARHALMDALGALRHSTEVRLVQLAGLSQADVAEYVRAATLAEAPAPVVEAILRETGGNALYIRQLVGHLSEADGLNQPAGTRNGSPVELGAPPSVQQVLRHRLSRLTPNTAELLMLASAFRAGFSYTELSTLASGAEEALLDSLDEATEAGFLASFSGESPGYTFAHNIIRHALYDELSPPRQARRHRRIAEALEQLYAGRERLRCAELAWQYHASRGLPGAERGIAHALGAAEQADAAHAPSRSATYLRMARDLAISGGVGQPVWGEILRRLALAEAAAMQWDDLPDALAQAIDLGCEDAQACIAFCTEAVRTMQNVGAPTALWEPVRQHALALLGERRDLIWARLALMAPHFAPFSASGLRLSERLPIDPLAREIIRREGDEAERVFAIEPNDHQPDEVIHELLATWERLRDPRAILRALELLSREMIWRRDGLREGVYYADQLLAAAARFGDIRAQVEAYISKTQALIQSARFAEAREMVRHLDALVDRLGEESRVQFLTRALHGSMAYWTGIGWPEAAQEMIAFAEERELGRHHASALSRCFAIICYLRTDRTAQARTQMDALMSVMVDNPDRLYGISALVGMAGVAVWEMGLADHAGALLRLTEGLMRERYSGGSLVLPELTMLRMSALLEDLDGAREQAAALRSRAQEKGLPGYLPMADFDLALALLGVNGGDRDEIQALLERALVSFRELGMPYWAERAEERLTELASRPATKPELPDGLTPREVEVLRLLAGGATNQEIADDLIISVHTVERHVANIYVKIDARNRSEATAYALGHGLTEAN